MATSLEGRFYSLVVRTHAQEEDHAVQTAIARMVRLAMVFLGAMCSRVEPVLPGHATPPNARAPRPKTNATTTRAALHSHHHTLDPAQSSWARMQ